MAENCIDWTTLLAALTYAENFGVDKKWNGASSNLFWATDSAYNAVIFWQPVLALVLVGAQIKLILP